ncbi:MAG TPA: hypothetical protein DCL60_04510, partial [Armatimonadetes bacterium]|nr:hypothetical protein [Armatimonadota bacterium]
MPLWEFMRAMLVPPILRLQMDTWNPARRASWQNTISASSGMRPETRLPTQLPRIQTHLWGIHLLIRGEISMRRLLIGLILAVCLIAGTTAIASADNILTNAGFESGKLTPWQQAQGKNAGFEYFTISKQTPHSGTYCVYGRGNTETRYNGFTTLVQDVELKPERGASYRISGFAKAAFTAGSGKKVSIAVREVDAEGKTIRYQDVQIDPAKTDWTSYVKVFTVSDKTVSFAVYIILNNLNNNEGVYFDDIAFEAISGGGQAFVPGKALPKSGQVIELKSAQFAVEIDASTGLLRQLVSLQPQPQVLHPAASQTSVVFFRTPGGEVKFHRSGPVRQEGRDKVSFTLVPDDAALPLKAQISYWMSKECFHESVVFESTGNIDGVSTLGLRHGFVPSSWEKIIGALRHVKVVNSNEQAIFSYGERKNDLNLAKLDSWQNVVFPMT